MVIRTWLLFACAATVWAADTGPNILTAAKKGQTALVRSLLEHKAPIEARNRDGRTPLMLAAEHGHADTVALLLSRGADPAARDKQGWTAWALALFSSGAARERILKALPAPRPWTLALRSELAPDNLYSSCSMSPPQLQQFVAGLHLETAVLNEVRAAASTPPEAPVTLVPPDTADGANAVALLRVRPQASCVQQESADSLSLAIDVTVTAGNETILEKTFGGGLKGLHARRAASPAQYQALFADWAKAHAGAIYQGIVAALLKSGKA